MYKTLILLYLSIYSLGCSSSVRELILSNQATSKGVGYDFYRDARLTRSTYFGTEKEDVNGSGVNIAIIDSGVDVNSHYLFNNIFDFNTYTNRYDDTGEGTHVAGIISHLASGAKIMPMKVSGLGMETTIELIFQAVERSIDLGARIINLSLGGINQLRLTHNFWSKLIDLGNKNPGQVTFVVAGGDYLENIDHPSILSVCPVDRDGRVTELTFMKSNMNNIDVCALGKDVYSIGLDRSSLIKRDGAHVATPFVSSLVALILQVNPMLSAKKIKELITNNVVKTKQLKGLIRSGGYVSFDETLKRILK